MPRSSSGSSSKRQGPHHHHSNNGNQSGLVPPATPKRSTRSRSGSSATPSIASSAQASVQDVSTAATQFHVANGSASHESLNGSDGKGGGQKYYDCLAGDDVVDHYVDGPAGGEHRKIDINPSGKPSSETVPLTVLPSFPLLDTITLLIIFLQLPSTVLTIIHFLFATQTFIGPNTTLLSASSTFSLPSFTNLLLQGSNGTPSLLTIIFADVLVAAVSMFLWPSARSFLIEFAQAVIAISLGAGSSSQNGGSLRNAAVCAGVMGGVKVVQGRFRLSDAWDSLQPMATSSENSVQMMFAGRGGHPAGWIRSAIAIHIVANGAMRATRTWLMRRSESGDAAGSDLGNAKDGSSSAKQKDPEAAAGASPQPLERDNSTVGNGKRKKKNHIQTFKDKQPLWGTIANAIVHIAKQVEQSQVSSEASTSNVADSGIASNESLMNGEEGRVWITNVGSTEVGFVVGFLGSIDEGYGMMGNGSVDVAGKKVTFPFFARVNGIVWPQTEIYRIGSTSSDTDEASADVTREEEWAVDVTGLTGATEYDFEFVRRDGAVFYRTSACTVPAQASIHTTPAKQQPARPLSPITTLLHSLAQANACLTETKSTVKATKKAHKTGLSDIRKEIEKHRGLLGNDRGEERAFRRNLALKESIKRAEEEMESMTKQLKELQSVPDTLRPQWQDKKRQWQEERRRLGVAQNRAAQDKTAADNRATAVESDAVSLAAKQEKLDVRLKKLRADLEKLQSENSEESHDMEKKRAERATRQRIRARHEKEWLEAIQQHESRAAQYQSLANDSWAMYYYLMETATLQQSQMHPPTPDSALLPGSGPESTRTSMSALPSLLGTASALDLSSRGRSYSTFSNESVITNPPELESAEYYPAFAKLARQESLGHASDPAAVPSIMSIMERKRSH